MHRAPFAAMTPQDLYDILRLRSAVFVVEQACVFLDPDDRDHEPGAEHLWVRDDVGVAAAVRLLHEPDGTRSIGRIVTRPDVRSSGLASRLITAALEILDRDAATPIVLGAQAHLEQFYGRFGFVASGPIYIEDEIPHVPMRREAP